MSSVRASVEVSLSKGGPECESNKKLLRTLKKGDIFYISRFPGYWHYCVFKKDEAVIHLTGVDKGKKRCTCQEIKPDRVTGNCKKCGNTITYFVRETNYWNAVGNNKAHKLDDGKHRPLDPDEIIKKAKSMIGLATYNAVYANCEHFATTCRYGVGFSSQTLRHNIIYKGTTWEQITTDDNHNEMKTGTGFYRELSPTMETYPGKHEKMKTGITDSLGAEWVVVPRYPAQPRTSRFNPVNAIAEFSLVDHGEFDVDNEKILKSLKMGNIVLVSRPGYWHYGVYKGNDKIIHLIGFNRPGVCKCAKFEHSPNNEVYCKICSGKLVFVRKSTFWDFASKGKAQIVSDDGRRPLEVDEIIRNAKSMLGPAVYDKENANCEHFATMCRYGTGFSTKTKVYDIVYRGTSWEEIDKAKAANRI